MCTWCMYDPCVCRGAFTLAVAGSLVAARMHVNKRRRSQEDEGKRPPWKLSWEERLQVEEVRTARGQAGLDTSDAHSSSSKNDH